VGKTSTKDGLAQVLSQQGWTSASRNSLNNHLGVPLSLARLPADAAYAIFEVGMNHAGEITALIGLIQPHIALITQVSYQHGQFFSGIDGIVAAKAEIFSAPGPLLGILPHDSPHYAALRAQGQSNVSQWITFGCHPESHVRLISHTKNACGYSVTISIKNQQLTYYWPLYGEHTVMNSLAIVAGAVALGADIHRVLEDFSLVTPSQGRGTVQVIHGITVIDESYNAAPASLLAALKAFSEQKSIGKRYILLGEMRELGAQSHACHSALIPLINACHADGVWLCGPAFQPFIQDITPWCTHGIVISDVIEPILKTLNPGDCILIKGANSMRTFALIDALNQAKGL
jgi:UDP-N-acetylmuramoyl-tripeptide--D-alanyl-D-alanine ligase